MVGIKTISPLLLLLFLSFPILSFSVPLSAKSRWIVDDQTGDRVKLKCTNWPAHLPLMVAEGLNKKPMHQIAMHISLMGFNCVRLTYAADMFTRHSNLTVAQSFNDMSLKDTIRGIEKHNPRVLDMTLVDAYTAVIQELGSHGIMVVLDNQVSKPMWCCNDNDGNGFWGDEYFEPKEWLKSLNMVATLYKDTPMVVAMSLRNELRGPRQNVTQWLHWVRKGAKTIHKANPNVLVLISGLNYDLDFTFLKKAPLGLHHVLGQKLVFETHRYSWSEGGSNVWSDHPANKVCENMIDELKNISGFLVKGSKPSPLFITEFGLDQSGSNTNDNMFLSCYLSYLLENDYDWAIWGVQGCYYYRDGVVDHSESFGMLDDEWDQLRNPKLLEQFHLVQQKIIDPKSNERMYTILYHPMTGRCIKQDHDNEIQATDCHTYTEWTHNGDGTPLRLSGTNLCLSASEPGLPVKLTTDCYNEQSTWSSIPNSRFQIATKDGDGKNLCLHFDPNYSTKILTKECICDAEDDDSKCLTNPQSQWFQFVSTNTAK